LLDERIESAHRLLDGRRLVPGMHPVQVDVIGAQATKGLFALSDDGLAVRAAAVGVAHEHVRHELRRDDDAVALLPVLGEVFADDGLRVPLRITVRRVDEVAAALEVAIQDALRLRGLASPAPLFAEGHRAEAERAHAKAGAAERHVMVQGHAAVLPQRSDTQE
jgi:hypothetical protein